MLITSNHAHKHHLANDSQFCPDSLPGFMEGGVIILLTHKYHTGLSLYPQPKRRVSRNICNAEDVDIEEAHRK